MTSGKIFPRNLTARADYVVRGNPPVTRPEDSVGNTIPGLELDERNLDRFFFPGLNIEFQRTATAGQLGRPVLREVQVASLPEGLALTGQDGDTDRLPPADWVYLMGVHYPGDAREPVTFESADDYDVRGVELPAWRVVRDLPPGPVRVLLMSRRVADDDAAREGALRYFRERQPDVVRRNAQGSLAWAILSQRRLSFVDEVSGVLNEGIGVGELQATMCTPWQYDFRDCKCYYWAASRPDVAASDERAEPFLKFMRRDRSAPERHSTSYDEWLAYNRNDHTDVINDWESLPVVIDDKEVNHLRLDTTAELERLATIEHALCVEYLFARYSLDVSKPAAGRVALELLNIATEEMRHLRWVNECLQLLGRPIQLGRASQYGGNFEYRAFALNPLTPETLAWFMRVEKPSRSLSNPGQIDGMYVRLLQSISRSPEAFPSPQRLAELIKLIIDEGGEHYDRFMAMRAALAAFAEPREYLLRENREPLSSEEAMLLDLSDAAYQSLLTQLRSSFELGDRADGRVMQSAVRSMQAMDEYNLRLARRGRLPRFVLGGGAPSIEQARQQFAALEGRMETVGDEALRSSAHTLISTHMAMLAALGGARS